MKTLYTTFKIVAVTLLLASCNPIPEIDDTVMLDGDQIFDLSLSNPEDYLVSEYISNPTEIQKNTPVLIAAHGYSASTFEWDEFREFADSKGTFYVSQVLLGGHGRSYEDFKVAGWADWQSSIIDEYIKLSNKGFKKIFLVGSSTGAPLIVQMLKSGIFDDHTSPKGIFLIDPIVVSSNKTLTMVGLLGPVLGYTTSELDEGEKGKWYVYRPQESLKQLMKLIDITRQDLQKGISYPDEMMIKVYKSSIDRTADPVSAVMLHKGMKSENGNEIEVDM
ncbi:MAG: hypothetical protein K9G42_11585, partial [Pedobacter sp.]|nr:hypothetical protein [Pedobacter sp.]